MFGDPDVVVGEEGPFGLRGFRVGQEQLGRGGRELVRHGLAADGVRLSLVDDLDDPIVRRRRVEVLAPGDRGLADLVEVALRVGLLVHGHAVGLLAQHRVGVAVDRGVDAHAEDVLVVLGQGPRGDDIAPGAALARVDVDHRHDPRRARLHRDPAGLVELVRKDVLVVGERDDELHHQFAGPGDDGAAGPPVGVFPADAVVLFVQAHHVRRDLGSPVGPRADPVKVLDHAEAVAAQRKVVGAVTRSTVTKVEGLLAWEHASWIGVWHRHFTHAESVHDASSGEVDVVDCRSFARAGGKWSPMVSYWTNCERVSWLRLAHLLEADPETPILPLNELSIDRK